MLIPGFALANMISEKRCTAFVRLAVNERIFQLQRSFYQFCVAEPIHRSWKINVY